MKDDKIEKKCFEYSENRISLSAIFLYFLYTLELFLHLLLYII